MEPDEDITGVIARVKENPASAVSLVIPRGGSIAQSIVNLKLLKREIEKLGKSISLVTRDKISKNLASQVGVSVYDSAKEAKNARPVPGDMEAVSESAAMATSEAAGIKINQYHRETAEEEEALQEAEAPDEIEGESEMVEELADEPLMPESERQEESYEIKAHQQREALAHAEPRPIAQKEIKETEEDIKPVEDMARKKISSQKRKPLIILSVITLIILIIGTGILLPSANAKITLSTRDIEEKGEIAADKSISEKNLDESTIPAKEYVVDKQSEKEYNATGTKDIGTKTTGEVTFYNDYDPLNSVVLVAGTALTAAGKTFYLDGSVTIPAAVITSLYPLKTTPGQVKGKVIAKDPGDSYNIAASKFTVNSFSGVKQEKIYGQSTTALSGGTTKVVKVVTAEDLDGAKKALSDELETAAKEELTKQSDTDKTKLVISSIAKSEVEYTASKKVNDESDIFSIKLVLHFTEMAFSEAVLREMAIDKIEQGLNTNEMLVNPSDNDLSYEIIKVDTTLGKIDFATRFAGKVGSKIEESKIRDLLVKSKYGSAESKVLALEGVKEANISVKPAFWPMLPFLKQRISVSFDYQKE